MEKLARLRLLSGRGKPGDVLSMLQRLRCICACAALDKEWMDDDAEDEEVEEDDDSDDCSNSGSDCSDNSDGNRGHNSVDAGVDDIMNIFNGLNIKSEVADGDAEAAAENDVDAANSKVVDGCNSPCHFPIPRAAASSSKIMCALELCRR